MRQLLRVFCITPIKIMRSINSGRKSAKPDANTEPKDIPMTETRFSPTISNHCPNMTARSLNSNVPAESPVSTLVIC